MSNYMPLSYGTAGINDQQFSVLMNTGLRPGPFSMNTLSPFYEGSGSRPLTLPMSSGFSNGQIAASAPLSGTQSPVLWLVGILVLGFLGIRYIHWK